MSRLATTTWGLRPEFHKAVYSVIAKRIVLYATPVWYTDKVALRRRLLRIQHGLQLCVTKCYIMMSTDALNLLSEVIRLDLHASIEREF